MTPLTNAGMLSITADMTNQYTLKKFLEQWAEHALLNLPSVAKCHPVDAVRFDGVPLLVIGPGPSLTKALPAIKKLKGKVLMIALQRVLRTLVEYGIEPEVCIALDSGSMVLDHLAGLDLSNIVLCLDYSVDPRLFKLKTFKTLVYDGRYKELSWYYPLIDHAVHIPIGFTISSAAVGLGITWGCDKIILVGVDLAYSASGQRYAKGDGVTRFPRVVPGWPNGKKKIPSEHDLMMTHIWMRQMPVRYPHIMFFQCSEGGAFIKGFHHRKLKKLSRVLNVDYDIMSVFGSLGEKSDMYTRSVLQGPLRPDLEEAIIEASEHWDE